ncbi:uncharacterized protein LAESUDRAFT_754864 [Laetiporus sulphureus 93-53]|uniref:Cyclase n=1 Tax=Laetiporus sulphureus 93-53 TaxID=1314785 RepID=A0A165H311_9APHY|nr:uncharacterized protein LAESUDRAFT_754864 [Laetiporus sulphureus 93-53]KZT11176.1 hypothetical protein LAESUDRAFT_754864 [Laetiporus sulphureus 93-53]
METYKGWRLKCESAQVPCSLDGQLVARLEAHQDDRVPSSRARRESISQLRPSELGGKEAPPGYQRLTMATDLKQLPTFDELPNFHDFTGCAWDVWGKDDELGTINLLTEDVVREAAKEIKLGKSICLNWPVNFPNKPLFHRQQPHWEIWSKGPGVNDDAIHINTQSGTQWDGLRHFGVHKYDVFYQNTPSEFFQRGHIVISDPDNVDRQLIKYGIHNWAQHGISGRGVLLDIVRYYTDTEAGGALPYDPWTTYGISVDVLQDCARRQGVTFRWGDILLLRVGFMRRFYAATQEERDDLGSGKQETLAGIEQSEDMKRFLWNNHFAAVASDQPAIESWPPKGPHMHQTLLALWGMPIGEFFDLEALSKACAEAGRYTFFFSSWPLNVLGGVASPPNAAAYL